MARFDTFIAFTELLNLFQAVERVNRIKGIDRYENDVEHSYRLTMLAWYIIEHERLSLNLNKVLQYALVHDFVEVYAGDTFIYSRDKDWLESKEKREHKAAARLKKELPKFKSLHALICAYEKREDEESRFVYALDKVCVILDLYLDGGRLWKEHDITLDMLIEKKQEQVALSPPVKEYFDEIVAILRKEELRLFPKIK